MYTKINPNLETINSQISTDVNSKKAITIFCNCKVEYRGRAVSDLTWGQRIIFIKPDKTVFVHQPSGRNPVNWMPEKSVIIIKNFEDNILINVESVNPRELMSIEIDTILVYSSSELIDGKKLESVGSEADMAKMIYEQPHLISKDFIPASMEEQTKYGFIDVLGKNSKNELIVIECKRYKAGLDAVQQLRRYVERLKKEGVTLPIRGIIAAPNITTNAHKMLIDWNFKFIEVHPPMHLARDKQIQETLSEFLF